MGGRAFRRHEDIRKLQVFLAEMRHQVAQAAYFQFGDLIWRIHYPPNRFDAFRDIRVWDDEDGQIVGFVFYFPRDDNPEFFLRPELYDSDLANEMVAWAVARAKSTNAPAIETSCIHRDFAKAAFLERSGFQRYGDVMVFMARQLDDTMPETPLPTGYSIVSGSDRPELASITGRSSLRPEQYESVRAAPGYRDDLGLRVCYRDQTIVSGCICWYDDVDNCGEFEPVGTAEGYQRRGLALAVVARTMNHLRRYGADVVYVRAVRANGPAVRLYRKLGFMVTDEDHGWRRSVVAD